MKTYLLGLAASTTVALALAAGCGSSGGSTSDGGAGASGSGGSKGSGAGGSHGSGGSHGTHGSGGAAGAGGSSGSSGSGSGGSSGAGAGGTSGTGTGGTSGTGTGGTKGTGTGGAAGTGADGGKDSSPPFDALPPFDAYPPPFDAYPPPFDAYPPPFDAYPPPFDGYPPPFDSGPPCNALPLPPAVTIAAGKGAVPTGTGGALVAGTYYLVALTIYAGGSPTLVGKSAAQDLVLSTAVTGFDYQTDVAIAGSPSNSNGTLVAAGTVATLTPTCPSGGTPGTATYTFDPIKGVFSLYIPAPVDAAFIYALQP